LHVRRTWLVVVLSVLAFAQTLAYYVYLRDDPGNYNAAGAFGDQVAYIELAQQVLRGTWEGAVHYMPGLPAVIAVGQLVFGDPRLGIAIIHGLIYALLVVGAARLAGAYSGERAMLPAAALVALNPALGYYAAQALTEFLGAALLFAIVAATAAFARNPTWPRAALVGVLIGVAGYLRAEYLALALVFGLIVLFIGRSRAAAVHAAVLVLVVAACVSPWLARSTIATGRLSLYNESPFSNLFLMGTWFRVFDEQTFAELQRIETLPGPREQAIERASTVGPRPDLSRRYMEQVRGPYERPLGETLQLASDNIRLNLRQYLVNHAVLAPVLIWAGHTPVRQGDMASLPSSARYAIWAAELALLLLALWQAARALRDRSMQALSLGFLGVVLFLTAVHIVIAVDERFTTPALPLIGVFAGARLAVLVRARKHVAVGYAA
jgi:hypothetical protein